MTARFIGSSEHDHPRHGRLRTCYFSCTARTCTGDGNAMVLRGGLPCRTWSSFSSIRLASTPQAADHRGRARRRWLPHQLGRRTLHGAIRAHRGEGPCLARRRLARNDGRDPRGAEASANKDHHPPASRSSRSRMFYMSGCPASARRRIFASVDMRARPIPVLPTVHYNMGGIPRP